MLVALPCLARKVKKGSRSAANLHTEIAGVVGLALGDVALGAGEGLLVGGVTKGVLGCGGSHLGNGFHCFYLNARDSVWVRMSEVKSKTRRAELP